MNALSRRTAVRWGLAVVIAAGLAVDAYTHLDLAHLYSYNSTGTVNEGILFRIEAIAAIVVAAYVLIRPGLLSALAAAGLAGGGAAVLVIYRYVHVGKLGPLPDMSEPVWFHEKVQSLVGELVAFAAALVLIAVSLMVRRNRTPAPVRSHALLGPG